MFADSDVRGERSLWIDCYRSRQAGTGQKQSFERVYKMHEDSVGTDKPFWELVEGERAQLAISLQGLHPRNGW